MTPLRILGCYRLCYCLLVLIASIQTLVAERAIDPHVVPLATAEIAGCLLLLWRRTQWAGLALLLLVFAGAQLLAAQASQWPTRFLQFAGSALLIVLLDRALRGGSATPREPAARGATAG